MNKKAFVFALVVILVAIALIWTLGPMLTQTAKDFQAEQAIVSDTLALVIRNKSDQTLYNVRMGLLYAGQEGASAWVDSTIQYGAIQDWEPGTTRTVLFPDISLALTVEDIEGSSLNVEYYKNNKYKFITISLEGVSLSFP